MDALRADGPHPDLGEHAETFGRLIGSWAGTYEDRDRGDRVHTGPMEVHFAWVLQGRAVQDLWIAPPRADRDKGAALSDRNTYGTTLRVFDPSIEAWRVVWLNPVRQVRTDLIGRRVRDDIIQTGYVDGEAIKWVFSEITQVSFTWLGFALNPDGVSWRLGTEFKLKRTA
jgi:hypothetical protein